MEPKAIETFSTVGVGILCFVLAIIVLAIFFTALNWFNTSGAKPERMAVRGVLKKDTWAEVHMQDGQTFERVRFIGFTTTESIKAQLPYELTGMVILEDPEGKRFLVRAKSIRMIVVDPVASSGASANIERGPAPEPAGGSA
jgi:hypothetical protein